MLKKDYVELAVDVDRMTHGKEVHARLVGARDGGLPWVAVLDPDARELVSSNAEDGENVPVPLDAAQVAHYWQMFAATRQHLTAEELQVLRRELEAFAKAHERRQKR